LKNEINNPNSLVSNVVKSIYQDREGMMWFGTYQYGLDRYDPRTKKFTHISPDGRPDGLPTGLVWGMLEDSHGNFWVSCLGAGVSKMDRKNLTFKTYRPTFQPGAITQVNVLVIFEDKQKRVWMGTEGGGLNLYNPEKDKFDSFQYSPDNPNSINNQDVRAIHQDKEGNLWIGTNGGGLNMLDPELKKFTHFTMNDGLPSNVIYGILEDDEGNLWLSTTNGLSRFSPQNKSFRNYDKLDGLQSNEFTYTASCKTSYGQMLFGGIEGFNIFNPANIRDNMNIPPVYITELLIFNKRVIPGDDHHVLDVPIDQVKQIRLPYDYSVITLKFTAINYTHTTKNRYAYFLENFEKQWNEVGNKREATYTNLDPGTYVFHVRACNNDGIWNMEGSTLMIIIDPPWYLTVWAKIIYVLLIICALILLAWYISNLFKRQKRKMEIEKKRKLLAQQKQFEDDAIKAEREILELKNQKLQNELFVLEQEKRLTEKSEQLKQEQLRSEKEILKLQQEKLKNEISYKSNELASLALHFSHKNEILISIKEDLEKVLNNDREESSQMVKKIISSIQNDLTLDDNWNQFELHFDEVHENFLKRFKETYPDLKPLYLKLCAYIRMKLTSKQIASLMNTSLASVEKNRYRLREKLQLEEGTRLTDFIEKF
jgi:streptogramin lyase